MKAAAAFLSVFLLSSLLGPIAPLALALADIHGTCVTFMKDHGQSGAEAQAACKGIKTPKQLACAKAVMGLLGEVHPEECLRASAEAKPVAKRNSKSKARHRRGSGSGGVDAEPQYYLYPSEGDDGSGGSSTVLVLHPGGPATLGIDTGGGTILPLNGGVQ